MKHPQPKTTWILTALLLLVLPGAITSESTSCDQKYIFSLSLEELTRLLVLSEIIVDDESHVNPRIELAHNEPATFADGPTQPPASNNSQQNIQ